MITQQEWTWNFNTRQGVVEVKLLVGGTVRAAGEMTPAKAFELSQAFATAARVADAQMPTPPTPVSVQAMLDEGMPIDMLLRIGPLALVRETITKSGCGRCKACHPDGSGYCGPGAAHAVSRLRGKWLPRQARSVRRPARADFPPSPHTPGKPSC